MVTYSPTDPLSRAFVTDINDVVADFTDTKGAAFDLGVGPAQLAVQLLAHFSGGGKRFRPGCCFWGYVAAAGWPDNPTELLRASASLDLLHVGVLIHDDVMDDSATRRGLPTVHIQFSGFHDEHRLHGDPDAYGRAGAIVLGDLLQLWSDELWQNSGFAPDALARAFPYLAAMRTEVNIGQLYDVAAQVQDPLAIGADQVLAEAYRVVEYKTSRYTAQRPTQIGAALGGADADLLAGLEVFGLHVGRAFQFRDDLLGIFGDPEVTGKETCDDLEEGKLTALIGLTLQQASPTAARELCDMMGRSLTPADVDRARNVIVESGARDAMEKLIDKDHQAALGALRRTEMTMDGQRALEALASLAVHRDF